MLILNHLKKIEEKEKITEDKSLYGKTITAKRHLITKESLIRNIFPHYTLHGHSHSEAIIKNLSSFKLHERRIKNPLNKYELFFLISASYLHDIGMALITDEDKGESIDKNKLSEIIRKNHSMKSFDYIMKNEETLNLDATEAHCLGLIAKGHGTVDLYDNSEYRSIPSPFDDNSIVRLDFLAALLRIADLLDINYNRVEFEIKRDLEKIKEFDVITQMHWFKHYYTQGKKIKFVEAPGEPIKLSIDIEFRLPKKDYENSFIIPFVVNPIKKEIKYLNEIFYKNGFSMELGKCHSIVNSGLELITEELHSNIVKLITKDINIKTLIIDDEELARSDFGIIVENLGYTVDFARNSTEALLRLKNELYNLILLDLNMPDLDNNPNPEAGFELIKHIKKIQPNCIFLIITAYHSRRELERECWKNGADDFIEKSWKTSEIKSVIENSIRRNLHILLDRV
jgi:CheY-like chemotaxis protein